MEKFKVKSSCKVSVKDIKAALGGAKFILNNAIKDPKSYNLLATQSQIKCGIEVPVTTPQKDIKVAYSSNFIRVTQNNLYSISIAPKVKFYLNSDFNTLLSMSMETKLPILFERMASVQASQSYAVCEVIDGVTYPAAIILCSNNIIYKIIYNNTKYPFEYKCPVIRKVTLPLDESKLALLFCKIYDFPDNALIAKIVNKSNNSITIKVYEKAHIKRCIIIDAINYDNGYKVSSISLP